MFRNRAQRRNANTDKRSKLRKGAERRLSTPLMWEGGLEDRRLLAAVMTLTASNEIIYQGSAINNALTLDTAGGDYTFLDSGEIISVVIDPSSSLTAIGSGTNFVQVINIADTTAIEIRTGDGDDEVLVYSAPSGSSIFIDTEIGVLDKVEVGEAVNGVANILGTLTIIDTGGIAEFDIEDFADAAGRTWTFDKTPSGSGTIEWGTSGFISYGPGVTEVSLDTGSGVDTVQILNLSDDILRLYIDTGDSDDLVEIWNTPAGSTVYVDTETGLLDQTVIGSPTTGLSGILGNIEVIDGGGVGYLKIDDSAYSGGRFWELDQNGSGDGTVTWGGTNSITYGSGIEAAEILAGDGNDFFDIFMTSSWAYDVVVNGGNGNNSFDVFDNDSDLTILGGSGTDSAYVFGSSYEVDIELDGGQDVVYVYGNFAPVYIETGTEDDYVYIVSTSDYVFVSTSEGSDRVYVDDTNADLDISTGTGNDIVEIFDTGFGTFTSVDTDGGQDLVEIYDNHGTVDVSTGDDNDTVMIYATSNFVSVDTGAGEDAVNVFDTGANLLISTGDDNDTVTIYGTGFGTDTTIDTGNGSGNVVNIGGGPPFGNGVNSLDDILGNIYVYGSGDPTRNTTLNIDDSGSTDPDSIEFYVDFLAKLGFVYGALPNGQISYDNAVNALNFWGGSGGNEIYVQDTLIGTIDGTVTNIRTGQGNDSVVVEQNNGPSSPGPFPYSTLLIDLQAGTDRLSVQSLTRPGVFSGGSEDDYIDASAVVLVPMTISGGSGDDTLAGGSGNDRMSGNEGDDLISGGDGTNELSGGLGNDDLKGGPGLNVFIWFAGEGYDSFTGGSANDEVLAYGADGVSNRFDVNRSYVGYEVIYNSDLLQGFNATSIPSLYLFAGFGSDAQANVEDMTGIILDRLVAEFSSAATSSVKLDGTIGEDDIHVGVLPIDTQALTATGLPYVLRVYGTSVAANNSLTVLGFASDDHLKAEAGSELLATITLDGGEGDDTLEADAVLIGGPGNDTFIVPFGVNSVDGVFGNDRILIIGSAWNDSISVSTNNLGLGLTQVNILQGINSSTNTVLNIDVIEIEAYAGNDNLTVSGNGTIPFHINAGADNDNVNASSFTGASVTVYGGSGDDTITGGSAPDYVDGGDGYDRLDGGLGNDSIEGGSGSDEITFHAGEQFDAIDGGGGSNVLIVRGNPQASNQIRVYASTLNPTRMHVDVNGVVGAISAASIQGLSLIGGAFSDSIEVADTTGTPLEAVTIDLISGSSADTVTLHGTNGDDSIAVQGLTTNPNDPVVVSGLAAEVRITGATAIPGGFNDILTISSGRGDDRLSVYRNLTQGIGVYLEGQGDADFFDVAVQATPGITKVTVDAGAGDDLMHIHEGNVVVLGGAGDEIEVLGSVNADTISLVGSGNILTQTVNGVVANIDIAGYTGVVHVDGQGGNDNVSLTAYNLITTVQGAAGNDYVNANGMIASVTLDGGAGDDTLIGGSAADYLDGGDGYDRLNGGLGNDSIEGGSGSDEIFYFSGDGSDVIDGGEGVNILEVQGATASANVIRAFPSTGEPTTMHVEVNGTRIDTAAIQGLEIYGGSVADSIEIADMTGTPLVNATINLIAGSAADLVTLHGTNVDDSIAVQGLTTNPNDPVVVSGLAAEVRITGATAIPGGFNDILTVRSGRGNDSLSVYRNLTQGIGVYLEGQGEEDFFDVAVQATPGINKVTVEAGSGDDLIHIHEGNVVVLGGAGDEIEVLGSVNADTISLVGSGNILTQTVNGVVANIDIAGYTGVVHVEGLGGNDSISLASYNLQTTVQGGDGNDNVNAAGMNTGVTIFGGTGNDNLSGGSAVDFISGGQGRDTIAGNAGNDLIFGDEDSDLFLWNAGDGNDTVEGGTGYDAFVINGTNGTDCFKIGPDNTFVNQARIDIDVPGGPANDGSLLAADVEHVSLVGGLGADYFEIASMIPTPVSAIDVDFGSSDSAGDVVVVKTSNAGSDVTATPSATNADVDVNGLSALIRLYNTTTADTLGILGGYGPDNIYVSPETLSLISVLINGGGGHDVLEGGTTVIGGAGNDLIKGTEFADVLLGGLGNDTIYGYAGDDLILADATASGVGPGIVCDSGMMGVGAFAIDPYVNAGGDDIVFAGAGNDSVNGGFANDTLFGEEGNDLVGYLVQASNALLPSDFQEPGNDSILGGLGNDSVYAGTGDDYVEGNDGNDYVEGNDGNDTIYGGKGDDDVNGNAGDDFVDAGAGNDTATGGAGNDTVIGGLGNDTVAGNDGNDLMWLGSDELGTDSGTNNLGLGGFGDDTIYGSSLVDLIFGDNFVIDPVNDGNDSIYGFAANDTIYGMGGNDWIDSGADNDYVQGDLGNDWINGGLGNDSLDGEEGLDTIYGGGGNDSIEGDLGDDLLYGEDGDDVIGGEEGNDTAFGGTGNDAIFGGTGNDFLNGGDGEDQIWGQDGNDTLGVFVYNGAVVYDNGADKFVGGNGDDMIAGALVDSAGNIVPDGNDVAFGQDGNDTIYGGAGGDMLYGGNNNDVILGGTPLTANTMHAPRDPFLPGDGNDTIYGGMGFDQVDGGNDNNLLDAGDDGIRETILGGTGNDMAYTHQSTDPVNYDRTALDGGFNHVFHAGGLMEPPVPAVPNPMAYISWVIPVEYYTGYKTLHNGDVVEHPPLKKRLNPQNGPNGPVKKPVRVVKPAPAKKAVPVRTVANKPNFAGKANTVGKVAVTRRTSNNG